MAYRRQSPFGAPNGWRLSGARTRVRCSRGLGDQKPLNYVLRVPLTASPRG
jgi:hypothetical protein